MAATIPALPLRPVTTRTRAVMIRVMMVIPLTGLVPTIAIALAATVVNRKEITATMARPIRACHTVFTTPPRAKNAKTARREIAMPHTTLFMGMSCWVRSVSTTATPGFFLNSPAARPTALLITPALLMMPIIPATAMPPMPMCLAYSLNIRSADISETVCVIPVPMRSMTCPPQMRFKSGIITNHTRKEPQQITNAYLSPTI